jgi:uncharacterized protein YecE (DUF72 family)
LAIFLGTSGWGYQEWVGAFYPNNRVAKLPFYCRIFNTVEVDSSFYRAPSKSMIMGWIRNTIPNFRFSFKIPKTITHDKHLEGVERQFVEFIDLMQPILRVGKLGCLLIQLPPSFTFEEFDNLESFFKLLPEDIHFAIEFRHKSWNKNQTWTLLTKYNVANTITDSPIKFLSRTIITTTTHSFVRWHGHGNVVWYDYTYSQNELSPWVKILDDIEKKTSTVYAYFNNHYHASAPINALQLLEMKGVISDDQKKAKSRAERHALAKMTNKLTDFI